MTTRWPWRPRADIEITEKIDEARSKRSDIEALGERTEKVVGRIIQIRRENHLGQTFQIARQMYRRPRRRGLV